MAFNTTLRLIEDLRLQVEVRTESATGTADAAAPVAEAPVMAAAFEELLLGIDRFSGDRFSCFGSGQVGVSPIRRRTDYGEWALARTWTKLNLKPAAVDA